MHFHFLQMIATILSLGHKNDSLFLLKLHTINYCLLYFFYPSPTGNIQLYLAIATTRLKAENLT